MWAGSLIIIASRPAEMAERNSPEAERLSSVSPALISSLSMSR